MLASGEVAPAETVEFRILGLFEVVRDGRLLPLGAGKERALLAILLLYRNERVSSGRLTDLLWDESPPESASKMIQIYVSRLRRALAGAGRDQRLVTEAGGYRLRIEPDELDLDAFERLLSEGRHALAAGDAALAVPKLREALSLWRGPPLTGLADARFFEQERARLEELRLGAVEEKIEAELGLGVGSEVVDELHGLLRDQPRRERPAAQLMLALYRSGRQADALAIYKQTRDRLVDELGIEPGRRLKELEQAILRQDPVLEPPVNTLAFGERATPAPEPRPQGRARRTFVVAISAMIAIAVVAGIALAIDRGGGGRQIRLAPDAVGVVRDGRLVGQAGVGAAPTAIATGGGAIWIASAGSDSVTRLDPNTLGVRQTIPVGNGPSGITFGGAAVWVTNGLDGTVSRIDPRANKVVEVIRVGNGPAAIAYGLGALWVANRSDQTVSEIDPRTGDPLDTLAAGTDAAAIAAGEGAVWVVDQTRGRVVRLEPGFTEPVLTINVGNGPSAIALAAGSLWVANALDSTVSRIDPRSNRVIATIQVGAGPTGIAVARDGIWVASEFDDTLSRIRPQTNHVDLKLHLDQRPAGVTASAGEVLVPVGASSASHRGGTLAVLGSGFDSIDPAAASTSASWATLIMTNDGLITFRRVDGVEGTQVVPDLATALPSPTDGGRTYTFSLRRGIHYSDGRLVRPEDFRRALERALINGNPYFNALVGARSCLGRPKRCDLSGGVVPDDRTWTITFHLRAPDPDFVYELALPAADAVPATTPANDVGTHPLPATGPYMIQTFRRGRLLKLVRNPRFRLWSQDAQPNGYPTAIVWKLGVGPVRQVRVVEAAKADIAFDGVPPKLTAEVETQFASQVRQSPLPRTTYMFLNTSVPPFDDVRVRRAVSYAADRASVVRALGGPDRAQPTCQLLPPGFPGYRPYCPFTLTPGPSSVWSGPDLTRARRLVAASGTAGAAVTVWIPSNRTAESTFAVPLLRQLGYRARAKHLGQDYYAKVGDSRLKVQAGVQSWVADYPAPWDFVFLVSCRTLVRNTPNNPNFSQFCDLQIDRQITRARALESTDPASSSLLWSRIDRELVDQAPVVPLVNPKQVDFLSQRVGNYQYSPQWGTLLDQLWVR